MKVFFRSTLECIIYSIIGYIIALCIDPISVSASTYYTDYSYHQQYYDNNGSSVSAVTTTWNDSLQSYVSNSIYTTANSYGAGLSISSPIPLIAGHTYSLSLFFAERSNIALSSKNYISVADSLSAAATDYANGNYGTTMLYSNTVSNTVLQFVFTVENTHTVIFFPWTTTSSGSQVYVLTELNIDDLGSEGVSQTDIANSLNLQTTELTNNITLNRDLIIQNQNQLNQYLIESQKVCNIIDKNNIEIDDKVLSNTGALNPGDDYGVTNYVNIYKGTLYRKVIAGTNQNARYCFYGVNKDLISCHSNYNQPVGNITIPTNAYYARFSIQKSINQPQFEVCKDGNQGINDSIDDLNDSINDDSNWYCC